jgi:hypothetical protein
MVHAGRDRNYGAMAHEREPAAIEPAAMNNLAREMDGLRAQVAALRDHDRAGGIILQRFLDDTTTVYAESVIDPDDRAHEGQTHLEPLLERDPLQRISTAQGQRKHLDHHAIAASRAARAKLSNWQRKRLDATLEKLLRNENSKSLDYKDVKPLLDRGADIELSESNQHSKGREVHPGDRFDALSLRLRDPWEQDDVVRLLLERGANPNTYGKLIQAILGGRIVRHNVKNLLDYGGNVNELQTLADARSLDNLRSAAKAFGGGDYDEIIRGRTISPLSAAVIAMTKTSPDFDLLAYLLERGADPNLPGEQGRTALHIICLSDCRFAKWTEKVLPATRLLLAHGADVDALDEEGRTPLLYACDRMEPYMVRELVRQGADITLGPAGGCPLERLQMLLRTEQHKQDKRGNVNKIRRMVTMLEAAAKGDRKLLFS